MERNGNNERKKRIPGTLPESSSMQGQSDVLDNDIAVAVYGTLKGGYNNNFILEDATLVGKGKTADRYPLIIRQGGLPFLLYKLDRGYNVEVEVYLVNKKILRRLDILEGHPEWYRRREIPIVIEEIDTAIKAWVYFGPSEYDNLVYHEKY